MRTALAAALLGVTAAFGTPWDRCAAQPGPFRTWINEMVVNGAYVSVEVAALRADALRYSWLDVSVVAADGTSLGRRTIGTTCAAELNLAMGGAAVDLFVCQQWQVAGTAAAGLVLWNNGGTADVADDHVLQYISWSTASTPIAETAPCLLPLDQRSHVTNAATGSSSQLVETAEYDSNAGTLDIYTWHWQGDIPSTFTAVNSGPSQWGDYSQSTAPLVLGPPQPDLNPATPPNASCALGDMGNLSRCSATCVRNGQTAPVAGSAVRFRPVLVTDPDFNPASCPPLTDRSLSNACSAAVSCGACENDVTDGTESDSDCGGGVPDPFPPNASLHAIVTTVTGGFFTPPNASSGSCRRCEDGRACHGHGDCLLPNALCVLNACTATSALALGVAVDVTAALYGLDAAAVTGSRLNGFKSIVAWIANGRGATVTADRITLASLTQSVTAPQPQRRRLELAADGSLSVVRGLATATDTLTLVIRIMCASPLEGSFVMANIKNRTPLLAVLLEDELRPVAPLVNGFTVSGISIVTNPYSLPNATTVPEITSDSSASKSLLSASAIAGIAVGAAVAVAILAMVAFIVVQRLRQEAPPPAPRRAAINVGEGAGGAKAGTEQAGVSADHTRASFQPVLATETVAAATAPAPVGLPPPARTGPRRGRAAPAITSP